MGVIRTSLLEAKMLHRRLGPWIFPALVSWLIFLRAQETSALRSTGLFWGGAETALLLAVALLPFVWLTTQRRPSSSRWLRTWRLPGHFVLASSLGIAAYGLWIIAGFALAIVAVCRITATPLGPLPVLCQEAGYLLLPVAALAPSLLQVPGPTRIGALVWGAVLACSFLRGFPIPTGSLLIEHGFDPSMSATDVGAAVAVVLATVGGLIFSAALTGLRTCGSTHAHRNPRRHP